MYRMLKKGNAVRLPKAYAGAIVEAWRRFKRGDAPKEEAAAVAERIAATYAGFNACGPAVTAICDACGDFALHNAATHVDILDVCTAPRLRVYNDHRCYICTNPQITIHSLCGITRPFCHLTCSLR